MTKEAPCLKILKSHGEKAVTLTTKLKVVNKKLKIEKNNRFLYIPLIRTLLKEESIQLQNQIPEYEITRRVFQEKEEKVKPFVEYIKDRLPPHLLASLPKAMDFVGDLAIIQIPLELKKYEGVIGQAIINAHKNVKTVLAKAGTVTGTYRLREFSVVAGEQKTWTLHKEHGCRYEVDLAKAYFSPRLSFEHKRVASHVREDETIIDMFAGVGPFSILIAKQHKKVKVYAIDVNPNAFELLKKNVRLNRVESKVYPILGDAKEIIRKRLCGVADRVIMNLPEQAFEFVESACMALKCNGGVIHFYSFVNSVSSLDQAKIHFAELIEKSARKLAKILTLRLVRQTAPYTWQLVIDAEVL